MHELQRRGYLNALGIESYVSRAQLPGAAPTRRLAVRRIVDLPASDPTTNERRQEDGGATALLSALDVGERSKAITRPVLTAAPATTGAGASASIKLHIAAISCGGYIWLEELGGRPLAAEQVALIQGMANALAVSAAGATGGSGQAEPVIAQFDWPMHNNRQLDNSDGAARAGLAAFVNRRADQYSCRAIVLLGRECALWLDREQVTLPVVATASTAHILGEPTRKAEVWRDLNRLLELP